MKPRLFVLSCCALCLGAVCHSARAQNLNPKTYRSPSGDYELFVDPSQMDGGGPARYRMRRGDTEVWSGERPFTLWDALVCDDGVVAGYSYEWGRDGRSAGAMSSALDVLILEPDGEIRLRDTRPRREPRGHSNPPAPYQPVAASLLLHREADRFIVRLATSLDERSSVWWVYQFGAGTKIADIVPDQPEGRDLAFHAAVDALIVPETPLIIVHWFLFGAFADGTWTAGARFSLLTLGGREVWQRDLPGEYQGLGRKWMWHRDLVEAGIKQAEVASRRFAIRSYSLASRIELEISEDANVEHGWTVREVERQPDVLRVGKEPPARPERAEVALEPIGTIDLEAHVDESPFSRIVNFAIDPRGRLGFVRLREADAAHHVVVVGDEGAVLVEVPVPARKGPAPIAVPVDERRWVLFHPRASATDAAGWVTQARWIDVDTAALEEIVPFDFPHVGAADSSGDGGFVVSAPMGRSLAAFDSQGRRRWSAEVRSGNIQDIAARPDGSVAALIGISPTIESFDATGQHERSMNLRTTLEARPNYVTGLAPDAGGGLILHDFNGTPPVYRISADDKVLSSFHPRFPDGRTFWIVGGVQRGPDGRLWTSSGHALLRLDEEGRVDRVLGQAADSDSLDEIEHLLVGFDGRIYALAKRSGAVHVFDHEGRLLRVLEPAPTDFPGSSRVGPLAVSGLGQVYVARQDHSLGAPMSSLVFGPGGERIGFESLGLDRVTERWIFQPGPQQVRWVLGYTRIFLVDRDRNVLRTIERRPSGDWLGYVGHAAVAPDGSLCVLAGPKMGERGPRTLNLYRADGDPIRTIVLEEDDSFASLACNGRVAVTTAKDDLIIRDLERDSIGRFPLPHRGERAESWGRWLLHCSADGSELWVQERHTLRLWRYRLH